MRAELKRLKRATSSGKVQLAGASAASIPRIVPPVDKPARARSHYWLLAGITAVAIAICAYVIYRLNDHPHSFNLQGMKITQVTTTGNAGAAALSPDRRYIVYVLHDGAEESLWVQQLATGSHVQVLPPDQVRFVAVSFTPDGNYMMFVRSDKSTVNFRYLYRMPVLGGTPQQLIRDVDSAPTFSPDGAQIAFIRGIPDPQVNQLRIANADGSDDRLLAERKGFGAGTATVSWSADGKNLAFVAPETRDNQNRWVLAVVSARTGEVQELHSFAFSARAVAWLPDGHGILVIAVDDQSGQNQIWFVSYPEGEVSRFTNDLTDYDQCCLDLTRDGDSLVALKDAVLSDIWVAKADGTEARQITSGEPVGFGLDWIGNRIISENSQAQWVLTNPDGSNQSPLTNDRNPHLQLSVCPDGKQVVYTTARAGKTELWRTDADGSNPVKLAVAGIIAGGSCSPDSRSIIYVADNTVWRFPFAGGNPVKLEVPPGFAGYSSDGKLVLYGSQRIEATGMQSKLNVARAEGGPPLYSFDAPFGIRSATFTPDGKAVAFLLTRDRATNIWKQPLAGGPPVQLTKFTNGDMFAFSWSRDGKQLAFSRGQKKTDVVMMSNFH